MRLSNSIIVLTFYECIQNETLIWIYITYINLYSHIIVHVSVRVRVSVRLLNCHSYILNITEGWQTHNIEININPNAQTKINSLILYIMRLMQLFLNLWTNCECNWNGVGVDCDWWLLSCLEGKCSIMQHHFVWDKTKILQCLNLYKSHLNATIWWFNLNW